MTKQWATRQGGTCGGQPFTKVSLFRMLTNPAYLGKVKYRDELHAGEHAAIVDEQIWQRTQAILSRNGRNGGGMVKNKYGALLKGLLRCAPCDCAMIHSMSSKGPRRYRYYVCGRATKRGWHTCPSKAVPVGEMDRFVIDQIRRLGRDPALLAETIREIRVQKDKAIVELEREQQSLEKEIGRRSKALRERIEGVGNSNGADLVAQRDELRRLEVRLTEARERHLVLTRELIDEREAVNALNMFEPVWETLTPREQVRIVQLLVERVDYDGRQKTISVTFRPTGIRELMERKTENAA